jgi:hypothetical protein
MLEFAAPTKVAIISLPRGVPCRDLYRIIKFLAETGYSADIDDCRTRFSGMLTFREFLKETNWGDTKRTYEGGFRY